MQLARVSELKDGNHGFPVEHIRMQLARVSELKDLIQQNFRAV